MYFARSTVNGSDCNDSPRVISTIGTIVSHSRTQPTTNSRLLTSGIGRNSPCEQSAGTSIPSAPSSPATGAGAGGAGAKPGAGLLDGGVGGLLGSPPSSGSAARRPPSESAGVVSSATSLSAAGDCVSWCRREGVRGSMGCTGRGDGDGERPGEGDSEESSSSPSWKGSGREDGEPVDMTGAYLYPSNGSNKCDEWLLADF